ncbi:MAG: 3'-5' exonuclease [Sphaerochaeta sp.]|jgi:DNA polymerase elongation subunit (family B)
MQKVVVNSENVSQVMDNIKRGNYKFYQFYNLEIEPGEFGFIDYMLKYKDSSSSKLLNKTYYDIETYVPETGEFTDPLDVNYPINSIAFYNNVLNIVYAVAYVTDCDLKDPTIIKESVIQLYNEKCQENEIYKIDGLQIEVLICDNEQEMLKTFFSKLRELNTLFLIGFNSRNFDDPYIFNRTGKIFGEEEMKTIVSDFGKVDRYGDYNFELPDYKLADLLLMYKPVGEGGNGLGKSLPNYKLNTVAKKELDVTKLDLDGGFRHNYLHNIVGYLTYNIFDVLLTYKLDEKLMFMELNFDLSKYNNSTMGATLGGRSILYMYRNDLMYAKNNQIIRSKKFSREVLYETKTV